MSTSRWRCANCNCTNYGLEDTYECALCECYNPLAAERGTPGLAYAVAFEWPKAVKNLERNSFRFEEYLEDDLADASPEQTLRIFRNVSGWLHGYCHICGEYCDEHKGRGCAHKGAVWDRQLFGRSDGAVESIHELIELWEQKVARLKSNSKYVRADDLARAERQLAALRVVVGKDET